MALIEEAVVARLRTFGATAALVGTRIYPINVPEKSPMPAIAYQTINGLPDYSHDGFDGLTVTFLQVTCEADTYPAAKALAQAVRAALSAYVGMPSTSVGVTIGACYMSGDIDGYNEAELAPVVRLEAELWHDAP